MSKSSLGITHRLVYPFLLIYLFLCSSWASSPTRFYFIHIQKTGGTSLHSILENQVYLKDLYPPRRFEAADKPIAHELISGHFPFWFCQQLDNEFERAFKVTILRNPIDRYLSLLRYNKKSFDHLRSLSLDLVHEHTQREPLLSREALPNWMCRFLASDPNLEGRELLENAKKNLLKFDFVLFLESFQEDVLELCKLLDIHLDKNNTPHENITEPEKPSPQLMNTIILYHDLDIELYEYAKNHLKRKNTTYRFQSKSMFPQAITQINYEFSMPLDGSNWCFRENVGRCASQYPIYRWVMDKPAKIRFPLKKNQSYQLVFTAQTLTPDIFPHILVNGVEIPAIKLNKAAFAKYYCQIPKNLITSEITEFTFYSPKSYKYNDIYRGVADNRKLSFAVNSINISIVYPR